MYYSNHINSEPENTMTAYSLMCAPSDQADIDMGTFDSIEAARADLATAKAEIDANNLEGMKTADECRWYVWDVEARAVVCEL